MEPASHMDLMSDERNSMLWWWPRFQAMAAVIPAPNTEMIVCKEPHPIAWALATVDGEQPDEPPWMAPIVQAADRTNYPCFLRGDEASGKHDWHNTCYCPNGINIPGHVRNIALWHTECMGGLDMKAVAVREYIIPGVRFRAFASLPICAERRYFVRDGKLECHHPYWPEEAVREGQPDRPRWEEMLAELNEEGDEVPQLTRWAEVIGAAFGGGYWSIDFMRDYAGKWWFIDCALGEVSWHPECEFAPPDPDAGLESPFVDGDAEQ